MKQVYKTTVKTVAICFAIFLFTFKANSQTTNAEKFQLTPSVGTWFNITSPIASNRLDFNNRIPGQDVNLMTLEEVEKFISKNNHLPDVPSESDVIENGISLGDMDAILLQKIEELTLYMIDLEKQNQLLNKEISKLKKNK